MADITITRSDFPQCDSLLSLLKAQRLDISTDPETPCHTLLQPGAIEDQSPLIAAARKLGAKRVVVIKPTADGWQRREELGGRVIEIQLAPNDLPPVQDAGLMMLAHLLAEPFGRMVAADPASSALIDMARRLAPHDVSVFINGPTGSGKEVLSRMIHEASPRAAKPFIALNCAAIPENMLEAILFGHEKGAFTGASTANKGYFRAADGGTLLLDEISEMPMALQAKLLRVLQEKVVTPVGTQAELPVDIRVLATSNRDMEAEIAQGTFREDLYFRLNVFPMETLALANRPLDIPVLGQALLARHAAEGQTPLLSPAACDRLSTHGWPGNVRELENVMQRALVLSDGGRIEPEHIMLSTRPAAPAGQTSATRLRQAQPAAFAA